jgi:hypothetical protein
MSKVLQSYINQIDSRNAAITRVESAPNAPVDAAIGFMADLNRFRTASKDIVLEELVRELIYLKDRFENSHH